jgi:hypothetical protein
MDDIIDVSMHKGVIETEIIVYILGTGARIHTRGSSVKIKGSIKATGIISGEYNIEIDLPENTNWTQNNSGLGLMVSRKIFRTLMIPPNFHVYLYDGSGIAQSRTILDRSVNFADSKKFMQGFWTWPDSSPYDHDFKACVAVSVKDGEGSQGASTISN